MGEITIKIRKNFRIEKKCPFCPDRKSSYVYKTWFGLLRHVEEDHLFVNRRSASFENCWANSKHFWKEGNLIFIRIWLVKYSDWYDIDIKYPEECEQLLFSYVTDNPSFRLPTPTSKMKGKRK